MVFSVKTYNNINQIGLKELGNHFQIDGDLAENPDAYIIRCLLYTSPSPRDRG